ncbi:ABC transporter ATP-binding protein [Allokutzneria sp. A3M-2-11 16]|uniref:ABC transporter ATP-binding protein n=1 Tax=Allokutzneria sp. A3M-2-11 16 TaxID=2962043 RepID=UPI0020B6D259|nr:ABC transporter ATP-binding protein [Allokutzneria sp. A3M-2-11 16]MCP3800001.1 ABC transporter ATP-binding protein [Allokutzneria sp. A3M-2-11 16]
MTEVAIATRELGRRYGRKWGLRGCSLSIPAGRVVGLVGPNGAGKSTLMNMMVGLLRPTEGELELLGERVGPNTVLDRVAYIDQEHSLYRTFKVREMLKAGRKLNTRWSQRIAEDRLRARGIPLDRKVGELSGGQRAQVALAVALATTPDLLILDEPVASLDPLARKEMMAALMSAKAETGCTIVLSSHVVSELERLCDHLVVLDHGRLRLSGDINELLNEHRLLVGPAATAAAVAAGQDVVHHDEGSLLVRGVRPIHDPQWRVEPVDLETLVMQYLSMAYRPVRETVS